MKRHATGVVMAVILGTGWLAPSVAEAGGKLIQMKNGRVLRADSVRTEGGELVATLDGGHTMAFPAVAVAGVEDDISGTQIAADPLNVIRSGREGGGAVAGFAPPVQAPPEPVQEEAVEVPVEVPPAQDPNASPGVVIDNQPANAAGAAVVTPGPGTRNRRVGRLGFKARPADN